MQPRPVDLVQPAEIPRSEHVLERELDHTGVDARVHDLAEIRRGAECGGIEVARAAAAAAEALLGASRRGDVSGGFSRAHLRARFSCAGEQSACRPPAARLPPACRPPAARDTGCLPASRTSGPQAFSLSRRPREIPSVRCS